MISFAHFGSADSPRLELRPGRQRLTQHWLQGGQLAGAGLTPEAGLELRADGMVVFSAALRPGAQDVFQTGGKEFVSGLWNGNVVELFLGNSKTGRYLEVHLAPSGKWWSCVFTSVRVREFEEGRPLPLSVIHHRRDKHGRRWEASVQVPSVVLGKLLGVRDFMELRANLAAIVHPVTGTSLYFSRAALPGAKPDFHQPAAWLEMTRT